MALKGRTIEETSLSERSSILLDRALDSVAVEQAKGYRILVGEKKELLRSYDTLNIDEVLAVCFWGRSGSRLFSSFLDSHDHLLMLPMEESQRIYEFLVVHSDLTLRDRLIGYPFYDDAYMPLFGGEFPIEPAHYYAAVDAVVEAYRDQSSEILSTSRAFFQCLHVAYSLAIKRRPAVRRPTIVYAQHRLNYHTARLVRDFPKARFIHSVRDPISCFDSTFAFYLRNALEKKQIVRSAYPEAAVRTLTELTSTDEPNRGVGERTRGVRFEDLHLRTEGTMRVVAEWLGIPYHPSLLQSSFNGIPWTVAHKGATWTGARPAQADRRSPNMWLLDRALVYALFHENFVAWNYPCPRIFRHALLRRLIAFALWFIPTKIELLNSAPTSKVKLVPALSRGEFLSALQAVKGLLVGHMHFMKRARSEIRKRVGIPRPMLRLFEIPPETGKAPR